MKKKIAILGSTGSIGKTLIDIIKKDKEIFDIILLTADKNYKEIFKQAKILNVKNLIITNEKSFKELKKKKLGNIKIFNNYDSFHIIFKKKVDYVMSSISGIHGLEPTVKIIKHTKKIAIANKEAIICGWHLIKKELTTYNTSFVPVDSEHFSIFYALQGNKLTNVNKIYLTASGGPLNNIPKSKFKNVGDLKFKESNRLLESKKILTQAGVKCKSTNDSITISGKNKFKNLNKLILIKTKGDHRICMSAVILALITGLRTKIKNFETVDTSFPGFIPLIKSLGGKVNVR